MLFSALLSSHERSYLPCDHLRTADRKQQQYKPQRIRPQSRKNTTLKQSQLHKHEKLYKGILDVRNCVIVPVLLSVAVAVVFHKIMLKCFTGA